MHSALYNVRTQYAALYCLIIEKMKNIANIVVDLAIERNLRILGSVLVYDFWTPPPPPPLLSILYMTIYLFVFFVI